MGKAPGPDGIKNEVLVRLPNAYKGALLKQFKASIALGFLPTPWLQIEIIYIKKAARSDYSNPKSYRPIGLSSSILKLCERLVNWHLKCTVLECGVAFMSIRDIINYQHTFTLNRSTETAISELVNLMEKAKVLRLL